VARSVCHEGNRDDDREAQRTSAAAPNLASGGDPFALLGLGHRRGGRVVIAAMIVVAMVMIVVVVAELAILIARGAFWAPRLLVGLTALGVRPRAFRLVPALLIDSDAGVLPVPR
jgi:hypothetical protein